jgi:hypothetical protein
VMSDEALRKRLADAAYARAEEFSWDATARRTLGILHAEVDRAAERPPLRRRSAIARPAAGVAAAAAARQGVLVPVAVGLLAATMLRMARSS